MGKKKSNLTQSQINGIYCIAAILVVSSALYFFSEKNTTEASFNDTIEVQHISNLRKKEDSVYHERRPERHHLHYQYNNQNSKGAESHNYYTTDPPTPTRKTLIVELNSADTTTLQLLNGIGPVFARRIVKYRERLGGFTHTEQLLEVYGFTTDLLEHISPYLRLDSGNLRKMPINSIALKQFIKHPYVEYYFARDLVNLRARGVTFSSSDDLRAIPSCTDTMLVKLLPYLDFSPASSSSTPHPSSPD